MTHEGQPGWRGVECSHQKRSPSGLCWRMTLEIESGRNWPRIEAKTSLFLAGKGPILFNVSFASRVLRGFRFLPSPEGRWASTKGFGDYGIQPVAGRKWKPLYLFSQRRRVQVQLAKMEGTINDDEA